MDEFKVKGMTCGGCVRAVTRAIQGLDPQARVDVDLASGTVRVASGKGREEVGRAIVEAGYDVVGLN